MRILVSQTDPDILVVTESWFIQGRPDSEVLIQYNYNLYGIDSVEREGGMAVYVNACLSVTVPHSFSFL